MEEDIIYSSDYVVVTKREDGFYIESLGLGMSIEQFNKLMAEHTEIRITSFIAIKNALLTAPRPPAKFGEVKDRIALEISSDELRAYITLHVMEAELAGERKKDLINEVIRRLYDARVTFGIKKDALLSELCNNKQILIAEGVPPVNGEDSAIRMYELKEVRPELKEDGNVDHYELSLINKVNAGDWLGDRKDPSPGYAGKSVKGNTILPVLGKKYPLLYDRKSVKEVYANGITTLYALYGGAVHYDGDRIAVSNHLEIGKNIDFKTGNIDFDGFLTVNGTVEDNFSVAADNDIEILGDYGVGSVKEIASRGGSIFIKGGIAGKNKAVIKSRKDIYTKYVSDAVIICEGSVHIGFYCLNSNITAKEVILDSPKGQIIGGSIQADIKVVASIIGSPGEKRTLISIKGFDRRILKDRLERLSREIEDIKNGLLRIKQQISAYSGAVSLSKEQRAAYEAAMDEFSDSRNELRNLEEEKKVLENYLRTKGEGEVTILKKAYPNTMLEFNKLTKEINKAILGTCFYIQDGEIREV